MAGQSKYKKRPDGNYQRSITVGRKPDGTPIRKSFYAKTIKELEAKAAEYMRQLNMGTLSSDESMTFGEMATIWLRDYKCTVGASTFKMYRTSLTKHLLPTLAGMKLKDLKPHYLQRILNNMVKEGYAKKTMSGVKQAACQIIELALDNDIVFRNVFHKVVVPQGTVTERLPLKEDVVQLITNTFEGHRMGLPAMIMLYCGLRRGEVMALTWNDIDLKNKVITVNKSLAFDGNTPHIKTPKTKSSIRRVPIPDILIPALSGKRRDSLLICPAEQSGGLMTSTAIKRAWDSYQHYLNICAGGRDGSRSRPKVQAVEPFTAHQLRHTFATMLYDAGTDILSAQHFLGHADVETTLKVYTHLSAEKQQVAVDQLNEYLSKKIEGMRTLVKI